MRKDKEKLQYNTSFYSAESLKNHRIPYLPTRRMEVGINWINKSVKFNNTVNIRNELIPNPLVTSTAT